MVSSIYSTLYSSTYSTTSTRKGIGGLVSGLDTDSMIQMMTASTRSKMAALMQKQTKAAWKMEAYQTVTTQLLDFKNKFMTSLSSLNSMRNASFYQSATITPQGPNASAISVTGASSVNLSGFSVQSIDKLASTAAFTSAKASQNGIVSADISDYITNGMTVSKFEGETMTLAVNGRNYYVTLSNIDVDEGSATANAANIIDALNSGLKSAGLDGRVTASLNTTDGSVELRVKPGSGDYIELVAADSNIRNWMGLDPGYTGGGSSGAPLKGLLDLTDTDAAEQTYKNMGFNETLYDKSITFNLNGTNRTITFDSDEIKSIYGDDGFQDVHDVAQYLDSKLSAAFGQNTSSGNNKVSVSDESGRLVFNIDDKTSVFSVASGSQWVIGNDYGGKGILGVNFGDANRLLADKALSETNFNEDAAAFFQAGDFNDGSVGYNININGTDFSIYKDKIVINEGQAGAKTYDFSNGTTMRDVMNTVNNSSAGVRMQYNSTTDNFSVVATESGTMGKVEVTSSSDVLGVNFTDALFGLAYVEPGDPGYDPMAKYRTEKAGNDAEMTVSFDGGITTTQITRSSNNFSLNGMNITLNSTFEAGTGDVTFTSKPNTDAIVSSIMDMVNAYNDIIAMVNTQMSTKPDSSFQPLTADQRKDMTQDQIDAWEAKAKEGLLFSDSILRSLASDLRFVFSMPVGNSSMSEIGLKTSSSWQDNGKIIIDEDKLRQAIENDPDKVADLFTRTASAGDNSPASQNAGIMARLDSIMTKYTNTVGAQKGLLINVAGHDSSPLSITNSSLYKEIQSYDTQLKTLQTRLSTEEDRYAKQFASLESYISQMNEQSSWLSQAFSSNS